MISHDLFCEKKRISAVKMKMAGTFCDLAGSHETKEACSGEGKIWYIYQRMFRLQHTK